MQRKGEPGIEGFETSLHCESPKRHNRVSIVPLTKLTPLWWPNHHYRYPINMMAATSWSYTLD